MSDSSTETQGLDASAREVTIPKLIEIHKTQRSIEIPNGASLAAIVASLEATDFDETKVRYESPLTKVPSPEDLKALGGFTKCEVIVVGIQEDGENKMRVMTGDKWGVNAHSLQPSIDDRLKILNAEAARRGLSEKEKTRYSLDTLAQYPILTDEGEFADKKWRFRIHNQPSGISTPSIQDMGMSVGTEQDLIVARDGVTVVRTKGTPSERLKALLPDVKKNISTRDILYDEELMKLVGVLAEEDARADLQKKAGIAPEGQLFDQMLLITKNEKIAEMVGIEVTLLRWDEDKEEIQQLCESLLG